LLGWLPKPARAVALRLARKPPLRAATGGVAA